VTDAQTRQGIGVSPGSAYGPVVQVSPPVRPPADEAPAAGPRGALTDVKAGLRVGRGDLEGKARHADDTAQQILKATALIARDKGLHQGRRQAARCRQGPGERDRQRGRGVCAQFEALGGYFAERVTDLRDVGSRAVAAVLGVPAPGSLTSASPASSSPRTSHPRRRRRSIVPWSSASSPRRAGARATRRSSPPRWASRRSCSSRARPDPGRHVRGPVDGDSGEVTLNPDGTPVVEEQKVRRDARSRSGRHEWPGRTRTGTTSRCSPTSVGSRTPRRPEPSDLEGVGLFRTEFVFLSSDKAPTVEEQTEIYRKVIAPFGDRRVVVRTLDAGADKPLAFADLGRRRTRPWVDAGCGCRPSAPTCSTPNSRPCRSRRRRPGPTSASWPRWSPPSRRRPGSPGGSARTACPRVAS
jgi:phosphotransferase system enzyme I (PtsI)